MTDAPAFAPDDRVLVVMTGAPGTRRETGTVIGSRKPPSRPREYVVDLDGTGEAQVPRGSLVDVERFTFDDESGTVSLEVASDGLGRIDRPGEGER